MINLGFHVEIFTLLSVILLVAGAVLGYGGNFIVRKIVKKPSEKAVLAVKLLGLALVAAGLIIIFTR